MCTRYFKGSHLAYPRGVHLKYIQKGGVRGEVPNPFSDDTKFSLKNAVSGDTKWSKPYRWWYHFRGSRALLWVGGGSIQLFNPHRAAKGNEGGLGDLSQKFFEILMLWDAISGNFSVVKIMEALEKSGGRAYSNPSPHGARPLHLPAEIPYPCTKVMILE